MVFEYQKNTDGLFVCPHCNTTKKNQNTMHYHLKKHEGTLPHSCKHCTKKFLHKNMLDLHISARHPDTTKSTHTFKCPYQNCEYKSLTKANRLIHFMRLHYPEANKLLTISESESDTERENTISCKKCSKEFNSTTSFYYHIDRCSPPDSSNVVYSTFQKLNEVVLTSA
jgi:hypothetical protein